MFHAYWSAPAAAQMAARITIRGVTTDRRRGGQGMKTVSRREQNHRQVIAEAECVQREEERQPSRRGLALPAEQREHGGGHEQDVQRVDLRDDGLAPEGVRARHEQRHAAGGDDRSTKLRGNQDDHRARDSPFDRRCEVEQRGRSVGGDPQTALPRA